MSTGAVRVNGIQFAAQSATPLQASTNGFYFDNSNNIILVVNGTIVGQWQATGSALVPAGQAFDLLGAGTLFIANNAATALNIGGTSNLATIAARAGATTITGTAADSGSARVLVLNSTTSWASGIQFEIQDNGVSKITMNKFGVNAPLVNAPAYQGTVQTVAAASSLTITPTSGETIRITLSATAITTLTMSAGVNGEMCTVMVIQDGTGSRTIPTTWTNVLFAGGTYTATATASKRDVLTFRYNSTDAKWCEVSRAMNM